MVKQLAVRQGYRFYAAFVVVWAAFGVVWAVGPIDTSATTIGYGWLALAAMGVPVVSGMYATRDDVFSGKTRAINRFNDHSLSGWPLGLYAAAILVWSVVFAAWMTGSLALDATVVAYGWYAIAAYGTVLTIGLISLHRERVVDALGIESVPEERI